MPRRTEAEALEDVSARMLQGWTMLGDACPVAGCNTPLVRSRQGEVWCARCGAAVVKEGDAMSVPSSPPSTTEVAQKARAAWAEAAARSSDDDAEDAATASSPRARPGWAVEAAEADGEDVVITQRKPRDAKARDAASAAIGQKLLSGWTLLDEACGRCTVGVPLMRDTNQRKFCVACDAYEDDAVVASTNGGGEDWRKFIVEEPAEDPLAAPLSEHLVKGYVLLGKQCPAKDCPSPLMRAPDGREVCVQPACVAARMMEEDDDDDDDDGEAALARFNAAARATQAAAAPAAASSAAPSEKLYLVKWKGCQYDACTWEAAAVAGAAAVGAFEAREEAVARRDAAPAPSETAAAVDWKEVPEGLFPTERTLRDYQVEGLRWLRYNFTKGRGAILGDEMGLGKTAQSVTLLQCLRSLHGVSGPFLIVVPLSTLPHWQRELAEWTELHSVIFHGNKAARDMIAIHEWARAGAALNARGAPSAAALATPKFDVVVTTYEMLVTAEALFLKVANWGYLVVDEAHRLKNRESRALRTLRQLPVGGRLALTGTPLQNHVSELWSILNFLDSDAFPQMEDFIARFGDMRNASQVTALTEAIRPYLLRREKGDVELGLVPMEETLIFVEITAFQKRCYKVRSARCQPGTPSSPIYSPHAPPSAPQAILEQNRSLLLRGAEAEVRGPSFNNVAMQLRHCCNHPFLIKGVTHAEGLDGATPDAVWVERVVAASGKMLLLDKLLPHLKSKGHRVLLFSQARACRPPPRISRRPAPPSHRHHRVCSSPRSS